MYDVRPATVRSIFYSGSTTFHDAVDLADADRHSQRVHADDGNIISISATRISKLPIAFVDRCCNRVRAVCYLVRGYWYRNPLDIHGIAADQRHVLKPQAVLPVFRRSLHWRLRQWYPAREKRFAEVARLGVIDEQGEMLGKVNAHGMTAAGKLKDGRDNVEEGDHELMGRTTAA